MWRLRQTTLDVGTLRALAAMWADEWKLNREYRNILVDRIDANAFLHPAVASAGERQRRYHMRCSARTLARVLCGYMTNNVAEAVSFLRVAPLSITTAEQIADLGQTGELGVSVRKLLLLVAHLGRELRWRADDDSNARVSAAAIVSELVRVEGGEPLDDIELWHLHFSKAVFQGANLGRLVLRECTLSEVDARAAAWGDVTFAECDPIATMHVQPGQRFDRSLPDVYHLIVHWDDREPEDIFGTRPCRRFLSKKYL